VKVVTLEELFIHLRNNFGDAVHPGVGQNLVRNHDFETLAGSPANRPADWFYATAAGATQLVTGEDSDGNGQRAAAINQANADWRSAEMTVTTGEQLEFGFDFQMTGVPAASGFRADARFFNSSGGFLGETTQFFNAASYMADEWHSFTAFASVPAGASVGDVRFSTYFGPFTGGQVLIDNVSLLRRQVIGDFNDDGDVDGDDLLEWKNSFGQSVGADADADGDTDGTDFLIWQRHSGAEMAAAAGGLLGVPEPGSVWLLTGSILFLVLQRDAVIR
jgi:hypothetical protein